MDIADIKKMSIPERLKAMEAIWDSFSHENMEMESPDWHEEILRERKAKVRDGKAGFISLADLKSGRIR